MWSPGFEGQAGAGEAAVDPGGPVLDLLQLALDDADQAGQVGVATGTWAFLHTSCAVPLCRRLGGKDCQ